MIRVLIPSFRDGMLMRCLASMERSQPGSSSRVIVLDNGISEKLKRGLPAVQFVSVPLPFVFARAYNRGVRAAFRSRFVRAGSWGGIVSLGDDAEILTPRWVDAIRDLLLEWPAGFGAITFEETHTREFRPDYTGGFYHLPHVALGSGLVIPSPVLKRVGPWEAGLVGYGFDDYDYGIRLYHAGYRLGLTDVVRISNEKQASGWEERLGSYKAVLDELDVNHQIYSQKWWGRRSLTVSPQIPTEIAHLNRATCGCLAKDWRKP